MKALPFVAAAFLAACASAPPPATEANAQQLRQLVVPGVTTGAQLQAALGPTRAVRFDSGFEARVYLMPEDAGHWREYRILIGPDGVVRKAREGALIPR